MSSDPYITLRSATPDDAHVAALLLNASQEPHFTLTAKDLINRWEKSEQPATVCEADGQLMGLGSLWLPNFHPTHAWLTLAIHPDFLGSQGTDALINHLQHQAAERERDYLWLSIRQDYLPRLPNPSTFGFREQHRTFGGGFFLDDWQMDTQRFEAHLKGKGYTFTPAKAFRDDGRLYELYALVHPEQVVAAPTITAAELSREDALWESAWLVWKAEMLIGVAIPERSQLDAWNAVLMVHPEHRRQGIGTCLLAHVLHSLQAQGVKFLNVAGSKKDMAYLGTLRRLGANIEPDWIAWER